MATPFVSLSDILEKHNAASAADRGTPIGSVSEMKRMFHVEHSDNAVRQ
jgi:hypothetical protein